MSDELKALAAEVLDVLATQQDYFKTADRETLGLSKKKERALFKRCRDIINPPRQGTLCEACLGTGKVVLPTPSPNT